MNYYFMKHILYTIILDPLDKDSIISPQKNDAFSNGSSNDACLTAQNTFTNYFFVIVFCTMFTTILGMLMTYFMYLIIKKVWANV